MNTLDLEVFRAGDHGERGQWGEEVLEQIAADYDPALHEAPVTVDHAQSGPALGWVEGLRRAGDVLIARLRSLDPGFAALIRRGAFKKRSVELYPTLRETGRPYLRAVSFLGACPPAVKGLADVTFAECDGDPLEIPFDEGDASDIQEPDWEALRSHLMAEGRWLPAWEEGGMREIWCEHLDETARAWFAEFLATLPAAVPTAPLTAPAPNAPRFAEDVPTPTQRTEVSQASLRLHRRAISFRESHPESTYSEALRAVACGA